jgi:phenylacetate-CoA ligase
VRTYGEICSEEVRKVSEEAWGTEVKDLYSTQEVGYIALQCPDHTHYHVQSESVFVEVLDENAQPVLPGCIGRVVVTPLHNFTMPLIRYVIGDYAEVGKPCSCGRGLPVLNKILGRKRNMLILPDGRQFWPSFPSEAWSMDGKVLQLQLVQKNTDLIVARIVAVEKLTEKEEQTFVSNLCERFSYPFVITIEYVSDIARSAGGKHEDFMSEI